MIINCSMVGSILNGILFFSLSLSCGLRSEKRTSEESRPREREREEILHALTALTFSLSTLILSSLSLSLSGKRVRNAYHDLRVLLLDSEKCVRRACHSLACSCLEMASGIEGNTKAM